MAAAPHFLPQSSIGVPQSVFPHLSPVVVADAVVVVSPWQTGQQTKAATAGERVWSSPQSTSAYRGFFVLDGSTQL